MERKKILVVTAHPDDESYGMGGAISLYSKTHDVFLVVASNGEKGQCCCLKENLDFGEMRKKELLNASSVLGISDVTFLNLPDGELCNNIYKEMIHGIKNAVIKYAPDIIITIEPNGWTGHIDHMAISMAARSVFDNTQNIKELWFFCFSSSQRAKVEPYFMTHDNEKVQIHFPRGYEPNEISLALDISSVLNKKIKAIDCHISQKNSAGSRFEEICKENIENYLIIKK